MIDLSEDARAMIELVRDAHHPDDGDRARLRAKLAARIGVAAGFGLAANTMVTAGAAAKATATAAGAGTGAGLAVGATAALKLIGAAVIISTTLGLGATVIHRAGHAPLIHGPVAPAAPPVQCPPASAKVASPGTRPTATTVMRHSRPAHATALATRDDSAGQSPAPSTRNQAGATADRPRPTVADEAGLLQAGVVARRAGHPDRALALFDLHARLYPAGVLLEERDAERALALADLGRATEARAAIDAFLRAHPASPLAPRLQARRRLLDR